MVEYNERSQELAMELGLKAAGQLRKNGADPDELFASFSPTVREHIKHHRWEDWQRAMGQTQRPSGANLFKTVERESKAVATAIELLGSGADRVVVTRRSQVDWEVEGEWR